jgi:hypothetical protein
MKTELLGNKIGFLGGEKEIGGVERNLPKKMYWTYVTSTSSVFRKFSSHPNNYTLTLTYFVNYPFYTCILTKIIHFLYSLFSYKCSKFSGTHKRQWRCKCENYKNRNFFPFSRFKLDKIVTKSLKVVDKANPDMYRK